MWHDPRRQYSGRGGTWRGLDGLHLLRPFAAARGEEALLHADAPGQGHEVDGRLTMAGEADEADEEETEYVLHGERG